MTSRTVLELGTVSYAGRIGIFQCIWGTSLFVVLALAHLDASIAQERENQKCTNNERACANFERAWANALEPPHLAVLDGDSQIALHCHFSRPPPQGGTFALGLNGRVAYTTDNFEILTTILEFVPGMWHSVHCMVLDASGRSVSSANNTFIVRPGSGDRAAGVASAMGGDASAVWIQHHDSCSADETHPLRPAANTSGQEAVAKRSWESCPAEACGGTSQGGRACEIEGLVLNLLALLVETYKH